MTVIGLGNPGPQYHDNRHNAGFQTIDRLAALTGAGLRRCWFKNYAFARTAYQGVGLILVKPLTFMNRSGTILNSVLRKARSSLDDLVVICDNLDLPPGSCRLKLKGSSGGQKGLDSIIRQAGSTAFKRLYLGIGKPAGGRTVIEHVLGNPEGEELKALNQGIEQAVSGILALLSSPPEKVMSLINKKMP